MFEDDVEDDVGLAHATLCGAPLSISVDGLTSSRAATAYKRRNRFSVIGCFARVASFGAGG
jgi:hypothetical protein